MHFLEDIIYLERTHLDFPVQPARCNYSRKIFPLYLRLLISFSVEDKIVWQCEENSEENRRCRQVDTGSTRPNKLEYNYRSKKNENCLSKHS